MQEVLSDMRDRFIIALVGLSALAILGFGVWRQQKRLPELEKNYVPLSTRPAPPPGLGGKGGSSPLDFAALFQNLKPAKQQCFREKLGEERLNQILKQGTYVPSPEDNSVIGECLLAGAAFVESATAVPSQSSPSPSP